MKKETKKKIVKIVTITCVIGLILCLLTGFYLFTNMRSLIRGAYIAGGDEYMCETLEYNMTEDGYCISGGTGNYTRKVKCDWVKLQFKNDYEKLTPYDKLIFWLFNCKQVSITKK